MTLPKDRDLKTFMLESHDGFPMQARDRKSVV